MNILMKMYQGSYVLEDDKIGHEFINLIRADEGSKYKYYIWLNSNGTFNHAIKKDDKITILMVRTISNGIYQILGKAEECQIVPRNENKNEDDSETRFIIQSKYKIRYQGIPLSKIYEDIERNMFVTFGSDKVKKAKENMYIKIKNEAISDNFFFLNIKSKSSMREYFNGEKESDFNSIITNDKIWENEECKDSLFDFLNNEDKQETFYSITKKEKDEIVISNSLAYFLDKFAMKKDFLNIIGANITENEEKIELYREKNKIDFLFKTNTKIVILENKINAGITYSNVKDLDTQVARTIGSKEIQELLKDKNMDESIIRDATRDFLNRKMISINGKITQLSKYVILAYIYARCYGINENNLLFYLLIPNYRMPIYEIDSYNYLKTYAKDKIMCGNLYKVINYSDVYCLLESKNNCGKSNRYYIDFLHAIKKLTNTYDRSYESVLAANLKNRLELISKNQK